MDVDLLCLRGRRIIPWDGQLSKLRRSEMLILRGDETIAIAPASTTFRRPHSL